MDIDRFSLEVWFENELIFYKEFKSITNVAKCMNCFKFKDGNGFWFNVTDNIKYRDIDYKELLRIWNS